MLGTTHTGKKSGYEGTIAMRRRELPIESITFIQPSPSAVDEIVELTDYSLEVEVLVRSKAAIKEADFSNWSIIHKEVEGSKFLTIKSHMKPFARKGANSDFWEYKITSNFILDQGLNSIKVTPQGWDMDRYLKVRIIN